MGVTQMCIAEPRCAQLRVQMYIVQNLDVHSSESILHSSESRCPQLRVQMSIVWSPDAHNSESRCAQFRVQMCMAQSPDVNSSESRCAQLRVSTASDPPHFTTEIFCSHLQTNGGFLTFPQQPSLDNIHVRSSLLTPTSS